MQCDFNTSCWLVFPGWAAGQDAVFVSTTDSFQLVWEAGTTLLTARPPDRRTRQAAGWLGDRLVVCGGGESWVGPFQQSCYQVSPAPISS